MLNLKEKALEDKRLEMAKVIKLLNDYQEELNTLEQEFQACKQSMEEISNTSENLNISELAGYNSYLFQLEQKIKDKQITIENTRKVYK